MKNMLTGLKQWMKISNGLSDDDLRQLWDVTAPYKSADIGSSRSAFERFRNRMHPANTPQVEPNQRFRRIWMARVAAAVATLLLGFWAWQEFFPGTDTSLVNVQTGLQETRMAELPDGTSVFINRNSQLIYPQAFDASSRRVRLAGEAFFEVTSDKSKPFIVETSFGQVRVLGTAFNVRSRSSDNTLEVFVKSGRVAVYPSNGDPIELSAADFLSFDASSSQVSSGPRKDENALAWKTGRLSFNNRKLGEVLPALERVYDVKLEVADEGLSNCRIYYNITIGPLADALSVLEAACEGVVIEKTGENSYRLSGSCCQ